MRSAVTLMRKTLMTTLVLAVPRAALACPVCFGQSDSPLALGANMGIWVLLGFTGAVLSAFASFFVYLMRRAKLAAAVSDPVESGHYVRQDGPHDVQEGIAEC
ncbi:MAG: hypothetical protein WBD07_16730 [Vicinamibacterales bacterium]